MPDLTQSEYANAARCYDCEIPPGAQLSVAIYILAQNFKFFNPMADITPSALLNASRCYDCEIPPGAQLGVMNYLLAQGGGGGGVGGARQIFHGNGPPSGLQTGQVASLEAIYIDDSPPNFWYVWDVANTTWVGPA